MDAFKTALNAFATAIRAESNRTGLEVQRTAGQDTYATFERLEHDRRTKQRIALWTFALIVIAFATLFLSGCTAEPYREYRDTSIESKACLGSYGGMHGYCNAP
jgi:hypothetical protein